MNESRHATGRFGVARIRHRHAYDVAPSRPVRGIK
ncbi:hypothetical protein BJY26_001053 [Spelaeicoccus albus]|uniref:Uncharacterized protein n=1 Tax=Spelaeicoccus albus TaxID=1280376 RepID=A0A7Z0D1S0_9MICO|nr:hypothetical protein [Spelaeicoccus albus]